MSNFKGAPASARLHAHARDAVSTNDTLRSTLENRLGGAVDRAVLEMMMKVQRTPKSREYIDLKERTFRAHDLYERRGYFNDTEKVFGEPEGYITPRVRKISTWGVPYEYWSFSSDYLAEPECPSFRGWEMLRRNRIAWATVMRQPVQGRPWVICAHGLGMGIPRLDFPAFHVARLYYTYGYNVVLPVFPMHGQRRDAGVPPGALLSYDLLRSSHGIRQAVRDTRRIVRWIRREDPTSRLALFGISLGAHIVALTSTLEEVDAVIAGIPLTDVPSLFLHHCPPAMRQAVEESALLGDPMQEIYRTISPLSREPLVPESRRYIFAGKVDSITPRAQTEMLLKHWGNPKMHWFDGGHVSFFWNKSVETFVGNALLELKEADRL